MLRRLLPLLAVLALLGQSVTTWASAGVQGDTSCCCPDPKKCECHDHDGRSHDAPQMKRCGTDGVQVVSPVPLAAVVPPAPVVPVAQVVAAPPARAPLVAVPDRVVHPDTPPF